MPAEPLLSLDTLIVRQSIKIDAARYEILSADELSVFDAHRFSIWGRRIEALAKSDDTNDSAELGELYDQIVLNVVVGLPADVFTKLHGHQKIAISDVFTGLLLGRALGVAGAMAKASGLPTGATFSPGSSASTAVRRIGGFIRRLAPWSARTSR